MSAMLGLKYRTCMMLKLSTCVVACEFGLRDKAARVPSEVKPETARGCWMLLTPATAGNSPVEARH